ncbi:hypothetical protein CKO31_05945 [Thiohalocapsa halophila]|uniref:Pentapeptide repeat-containing protein n=1 Tax=Thiohalocapsa halophila TaxID=69359 RepID=A0ABS1CFY5_9GAMM|nr:hypothetical protein [Thiohalocapsa halophila]
MRQVPDECEALRPSGRVLCTDRAISQDLQRANFRNYQFLRLVAQKKRFENCDFSYSEFDAAYLRRCVFEDCKFIGCRFSSSNLSGSQFLGCDFEYATFSNTLIDPEVLEFGLPGRENLQLRFARALRINYAQIGDTQAANKAIQCELSANRVHLFKAWASRESYYRKHYRGFKRFRHFLEWLSFIILDFSWGNGESWLKLFRTIAIVVAAIGLGQVYYLGDWKVLSDYREALLAAPGIFLGVDNAPQGYSSMVLAGIAATRYILFAFLVSILVKRLGRR